VMGASGGGPHALACAALLPERVSATACQTSLAPSDADGLDWFGGMASDSASLRAALLGRAARDEYEQTAEFDPESFIDLATATLPFWMPAPSRWIGCESTPKRPADSLKR